MDHKKAIDELRKEKNILILAHYYVDGELQDIADIVGDSYQLAKEAQETDKDIICFLGVNFMGESAKILSPDKKVIMPDLSADCPMAHMVTVEKIREMRDKYEDLAVVAYVNTTAEIKTAADVCVTSSNGEKIVGALPNKNIFFVPDRNLGSYIAGKLEDKNIVCNDGYCPIHNRITKEEVARQVEKHPKAKVCIHPESPPETLPYGDCIGSTAMLLEYVKTSPAKEFIIVTEEGILHQMKKYRPDATFYLPRKNQVCEDMKFNTVEKLYQCLKDETGEIVLDDETIRKATDSLEKMMELSK
ncbi:MAG: quinolinate synthase NadA [Anaerovoracaceae bacterium]